MNRSSLLGFSLLMALMFGYLYYNQKQGEIFRQQKIADSIAQQKLKPQVPITDTQKTTTAVVKDTNSVPEQTFTLQNKDVVFTFSNLGAKPLSAVLQKYKTATPAAAKHQVKVFGEFGNAWDLFYNSAAGTVVHTDDLSFAGAQTKNAITFTHPSAGTIIYTLPDSGYALEIDIQAPSLAAGQAMQLTWNSVAPNNEYDANDDLQYTQIAYNETQEGFDYNTLSAEKKKDFKEGVKWLCFKQHYFNATLMSATPFAKGSVVASPMVDSSNMTVAKLSANFTFAPGNGAKLKLFAGPNEYDLLKAQGQDLQEVIPYGYGIFKFVKYINKWFMIPVFKTLSKFFTSWGLVIMLLTIIVRLVTSPLIYKSYLSGAKMKALKPELDQLRKECGDDQQAYAMKSMALQRSAGVNMLGGCLPVLLQLPIFFALLSLFPNAIELRQQSFLWTKDLSTFDSIASIPNIPLYGDHVSLWTLIFVASQLFLALYSLNMAQTTDQNNPVLKYLPFIMPIMFLGIFNRLPASLTFYYCVSNIITIILQIVIQKFIIKEDKLRAQIKENMSKEPKQNKFMEAMVKAQQDKAAQDKARQQKRNS